jgi:hypothetical protein
VLQHNMSSTWLFTIKKYYCQLNFLQNRFTFSETGRDEVFFTWYPDSNRRKQKRRALSLVLRRPFEVVQADNRSSCYHRRRIHHGSNIYSRNAPHLPATCTACENIITATSLVQPTTRTMTAANKPTSRHLSQ